MDFALCYTSTDPASAQKIDELDLLSEVNG